MRNINAILVLIILTLSVTGYSQKYVTRNGDVTFDASVPAVEEVKATNSSCSALFDASNGKLAVSSLVKGYAFKKALMEEHFNENYAESHDYPKATFSGGLENFNLSEIGSSAQQYTMKGKLTFHGVTKNILVKNVSVRKKGNELIIDGSFYVKASSFEVSIPGTVSGKVKDLVKISFTLNMTKR